MVYIYCVREQVGPYLLKVRRVAYKILCQRTSRTLLIEGKKVAYKREQVGPYLLKDRLLYQVLVYTCQLYIESAIF